MILSGISLSYSRLERILVLNIILCIALKSASSSRIVQSFNILIFPEAFFSITDKSLVYSERGLLFLIARLTKAYLDKERVWSSAYTL